MNKLDKNIYTDCQNELENRYEQVKYDDGPDNEAYCLEEFLECETLRTYQNIALKCNYFGIKTVYDIGCCYGHQCCIFEKYNINYIGIDVYNFDFYHKNKHKYVVNRYPFHISFKGRSVAAISSLCVGWLVTDEIAIKRLATDFSYFIGNIDKRYITDFKKHFYIRKCGQHGFRGNLVLESSSNLQHATHC